MLFVFVLFAWIIETVSTCKDFLFLFGKIIAVHMKIQKNHRQEHTKAIEQVVIKPWLLDLMANQKLTSTNAAHSLTSQKSLLMTTLLANECEGRSLPKANGHL